MIVCSAVDSRTLWVEGHVVGLPQSAGGTVRCELRDAHSATYRIAQEPARLSWYGGPPVNSGERWRLAVKLKRPKELLNPQGFELQAWLFGATNRRYRQHQGWSVINFCRPRHAGETWLAPARLLRSAEQR